MKRKQPESRLQSAVYDYIRRVHHDVLCFHVPNGGKRNAIEARIMKGMGVMPGVADLLIFWRGGHGAIELKAPESRGKQSEHQLTFEQLWKFYGGQYAVCKSIDDVDGALSRWKKAKHTTIILEDI